MSSPSCLLQKEMTNLHESQIVKSQIERTPFSRERTSLVIDLSTLWFAYYFGIHEHVEVVAISQKIFALYSVVLNKRAARLLFFQRFSYLHALIKYLQGY